jgi:hypothetical protein
MILREQVVLEVAAPPSPVAADDQGVGQVQQVGAPHGVVPADGVHRVGLAGAVVAAFEYVLCTLGVVQGFLEPVLFAH